MINRDTAFDRKNLWNGGYVAIIEDKLGIPYKDINASEENRINAITTIAAISRGKDKANDPKKRMFGKHGLIKEAADNLSMTELIYREEVAVDHGLDYVDEMHAAGRPLEYCPIATLYVEYNNSVFMIDIDNAEIFYVMDKLNFHNDILRFSHTARYEDYIENPSMFSPIDEVKKFDENVKASIPAINLLEGLPTELKIELDKARILWTNLRALVNAGVPYEQIPFNKSMSKVLLSAYFILEFKVPYFSFAQLRTHGQLSQVAVSERYAVENDVWLPDDLLDRVLGLGDKIINYESFIFDPIVDELRPKISQTLDMVIDDHDLEYKKSLLYDEIIERLVGRYTIPEVKKFFKRLGYHREIYNRWFNHMKYKTFIVGGYLDDKYQWGHFLLERHAFPVLGIGGGTQSVTAKAVQAARKLIEYYYKLEKGV